LLSSFRSNFGDILDRSFFFAFTYIIGLGNKAIKVGKKDSGCGQRGEAKEEGYIGEGRAKEGKGNSKRE